MIKITDNIILKDNDISFEFIHSSGPGGQNVNKVATAVQLRFNISDSSIPEYVKENLYKLAKKKISREGFLIITAKRSRSQDRNRTDAVNRLVKLILNAEEKAKPRVKTKPTAVSKKKRIEEKLHRGKIKNLRSQKIQADD